MPLSAIDNIGWYIQQLSGSAAQSVNGAPAIDATGDVSASAVGTGNTNALFALDRQAGGSYNFVADNSGLCIDTPGSSITSGVQLQQYTCNNSSAQQFSLVQE